MSSVKSEKEQNAEDDENERRKIRKEETPGSLTSPEKDTTGGDVEIPMVEQITAYEGIFNDCDRYVWVWWLQGDGQPIDDPYEPTELFSYMTFPGETSTKEFEVNTLHQVCVRYWVGDMWHKDNETSICKVSWSPSGENEESVIYVSDIIGAGVLPLYGDIDSDGDIHGQWVEDMVKDDIEEGFNKTSLTVHREQVDPARAWWRNMSRDPAFNYFSGNASEFGFLRRSLDDSEDNTSFTWPPSFGAFDPCMHASMLSTLELERRYVEYIMPSLVAGICFVLVLIGLRKFCGLQIPLQGLHESLMPK
eukprot:gnl/MRDRNA2_/MRDRNA2_120140_c0_seq1.p1 gnl/MRDRNA2_/MRDRNA2_120140_c0~~gnl/MRDRNA2_/MRDRNA2_120140_c0_seq1.p1  ORF type:complete len:306 (+),score=62.23 gnl/MRDRNA2_/MRDRNA2_120140_c0_seq1:231-1148(+)